MSEWGLDVKWILDILKSLIASTIFFLIGLAFGGVIYPAVKKRANPLSEILPFSLKKKENYIYICYGLANPKPRQNYYVVEEGDLSAIYSVVDIFTDIYKRERVNVLNHLSTEAILSEIKNIVTVSGPVWNCVTELFIGKIGSPVIFDRNSKNLVLTEKGEGKEHKTEYRTTYRKPNEPKKCHGIILCGEVERADGKKQNVLVCAGNSHLSTYGAVIFLRQLYNSRKLSKTLKAHCISGAPRWRLLLRSLLRKLLRNTRVNSTDESRRWGLILEVVDKSQPNLRRTRGLPMNPSHLDVKIVKYLTEDMFFNSFEYHY